MIEVCLSVLFFSIPALFVLWLYIKYFEYSSSPK